MASTLLDERGSMKLMQTARVSELQCCHIDLFAEEDDIIDELYNLQLLSAIFGYSVRLWYVNLN